MKRTTRILAILGLLVLQGWACGGEPIPGLVAHWKLDEGTGNTASDSVGANHGTIYGATWTAGQLDGALNFDGAADYVEATTLNNIDEPITVSAWIKVNNLDFHQSIFGRNQGTGGGYCYENWLSIGGENYNKVRFGDRGGGGGDPFVYSISSIKTDTWYNVVATKSSAGDIEIYINGVLDNTGTGIDCDNTGVNYRIGTINTGHYPFNGIIDDVRVYDRALTAEEVSQLYQNGLLKHSIGVIKSAIDEKLGAVERIDAALEKEQAAYDALEEMLYNKYYGDLTKGDIVKAKQKTHSAMQHEEQSIDDLEKSIEKLEDAMTALGWEPPQPPQPIAWWKFDEGSGNIAGDSVGDNNGIIYGATWTAGQIGSALDFDGSEDYVDCGGDTSLEIGGSEWSATAWFKISDRSKHKGILNTWSGKGSDDNYRIVVYDAHFAGGAQDKVSFVVYDGSARYWATSATSVTNGNWHHTVGVRDANGIRIYVDGVEEDSDPLASSAHIANSANLTIGKGFANGWDFNGEIDDVRIYDKALSAEEVSQLYQEGL